MADRSKIEWTDASWNPIRARNTATGKVGWHCERATTGCAGCYAEAFNRRLGTGLPFKPGHLDSGDVELFLDERMLLQPLRWTRPRTIFVCSMTDLFGRFVKDEWLDKIFAVTALTPQHDYQIVTKRSDRMRVYLTKDWTYESIYNAMGRLGSVGATESHPYRTAFPNGRPWPLPNIWLGVSAERQDEANARIPDLLATPAAVRFVSAEPLLGPIDLTRPVYHGEAGISMRGFLRDAAEPDDFRYHTTKLDWVIVGGESGRNARPMHPDWARSLRDQCQAADAAFFFKQWGEWAPNIGAIDGWTIVDDPEISKFAHREWEDGRWSDEFWPMWCDFEDGNYDETQCVSRVGKRVAGRLLDGVEHNAMPERDR
ncbi:phage Gp37/Gp68 family protein [Bradyrhizobium sp. SZCCHNRI1003]|uniref:DUF5131 family protein n=1 Tax=Bradyrhizobium sp. SZCCHNRI1003 TaxID=3057275 RepID=UPI002916A31C|nr:phage Gp37/Gp68 family protein [Bradyrhizobium sp. SZCCHNRI1003]